MNNNVSIGDFINRIAKEKSLSLYEISKRVPKHTPPSYEYITQIARGIKKRPHPDVLKSLAPAMGVEYYELMVAAGYIDKSELTGIVRELYGPILDDRVIDLLVIPEMIEFLRSLERIPNDRLNEVLRPATSIAKGSI